MPSLFFIRASDRLLPRSSVHSGTWRVVPSNGWELIKNVKQIVQKRHEGNKFSWCASQFHSFPLCPTTTTATL